MNCVLCNGCWKGCHGASRLLSKKLSQRGPSFSDETRQVLRLFGPKWTEKG